MRDVDQHQWKKVNVNSESFVSIETIDGTIYTKYFLVKTNNENKMKSNKKYKIKIILQ